MRDLAAGSIKFVARTAEHQLKRIPVSFFFFLHARAYSLYCPVVQNEAHSIFKFMVIELSRVWNDVLFFFFKYEAGCTKAYAKSVCWYLCFLSQSADLKAVFYLIIWFPTARSLETFFL